MKKEELQHMANFHVDPQGGWVTLVIEDSNGREHKEVVRCEEAAALASELLDELENPTLDNEVLEDDFEDEA